jgi:hypothetical protein
MTDDSRGAMSDDDLRAALRASHAGDAPPPFARTLDAARGRDPARKRDRARKPRRRRAIPIVVLAGAAAIALLLFLRRHPTEPRRTDLALDGIGMRTTTLHLPLDSLLDIPGQDLLSTTPDLTGGALP